MAEETTTAPAGRGDTATAVGALVLGAMLLLVVLRKGFGDLIPRIGG